MTDRYVQAKAIALEALEQAANTRADWLQQRCGDDADLRLQVDWLLAAAATDSGDHPLQAWPATDTSVPRLDSGVELNADRPGQYRILRQLGEGGMGVVYLAERVDGDTRQQVALKMLGGSNLSSQRLAARIAEERRILASLHHPGIAHLVDGGVTDGGQPFIAMEYVEGERIDQWCQAHALPLRARVALFLKVCAAVEHAHQRLVIHRDLKPANILVNTQGEPKLLDFGIARRLEADGDDLDPTRTAHRALTLAYASPEHIEGLHLTTATDIWSLGVVLYELLTGTRPHGRPGSEHQLSQNILSGEIRPPSAHHGDQTREVVATVGRIPADLDAIVLKALRPVPEQRYASVAALAEDLRRFLESRPVLARRGHALYRLRRFAWRNRWPLAATAVMLLAASAFLWDRGRQLQQVTDERNKALALGTFMSDLFGNADPSRERGERITVREVLERGASDLQRRADLSPDVRADLMLAIADANASLGLERAAEPLLAEVLRTKQEAGAGPIELARLMKRLATTYYHQGRNADAIDLHRRAQALLSPNDPAHFRAWAEHRTHELRNEDLATETPAKDMVAKFQSHLAALDNAKGIAESDQTALAAARNETLAGLASAQQRNGDSAAAVNTQAEVVAFSEQHLRHSPLTLITHQLNHAAMLLDTDLPAGIKALEQADKDYVTLIGEHTTGRAVLLNQLSVGYYRAGRNDEAMATGRRSYEVARATATGDNRLYLQLAVGHAMSLIRMAQHAEAEAVLHEVLPELKKRSAPGVDAVNYAYALGAMAFALVNSNRELPTARDYAHQAEQVMLPHARDFFVVYDTAMLQQTRALQALGDRDGAAATVARYKTQLGLLSQQSQAQWQGNLKQMQDMLAR